MKRYFILIITVCSFLKVYGTHNRAGEITYKREPTNPFLYHFTIITYTKTTSDADRPWLTLVWGDGKSDSLARSSKIPVGPDISKNTYFGTHLYSGMSTYIIYFEDPNRNGGVVNIPGSINIPFWVESKLIISPFLGYNNSPDLLQPPIDDGAVGVPFIHNPSAYDPDGDSLSYELIYCKTTGGVSIPGYFYPPATQFYIDAVTGDLVWNFPQSVGEFNVAFLIKEWRNGINIGYVERDMQITIITSTNQPPVFSSLPDICVEAGSLITFNVTATDPDNETITLGATGGPFYFNPDSAEFPEVTGFGSVTGTFTWQTTCKHVRKAPYTVVFKARDNNTQIQLANFETVNIWVVAPSPKNPVANPLGYSIILNWDKEVCDVLPDSAKGYYVYRRNGTYGFTPGLCQTGVPPFTGYLKIATVNGINNTTYTDNDNGAGLIHGINYCYMVVAFFKDGAQSYASEEFCAKLRKDIAVITNVSVVNTDAANGIMDIAWSKPTELDTVQFPGPFEYRILRWPGLSLGTGVQVGVNFGLDDTTFTDTGLNTVNNAYSYKIELVSTTIGSIGYSHAASSVFLSISPTDRKLILTWQENVPWTNTRFDIYKFNGATFDSIGSTISHSFTDAGLINYQQYCYYIKSIGNYSADGFIDPIINLSQQVCEEPIDNVPPCVTASSYEALNFDCTAGEVNFQWQQPDIECGGDVGSYNVYYSQMESGPFSVIAVITNPGQTYFYFNSVDSIAGCYYVTAIDTVGNESVPFNTICLENCPFYELPNIITPDGSGDNDELVPFPYRNVQDIDLTIFNRWGQIVFSTTDPDINWNGRVNNSGKDCPDGVYYYICTVNEKYRSGIRTRALKPSFLHIIRSGNSISK
ncbi:MAG: gliding motility-associated C-terminal domain-containing protein [Bacteroidia bacterium]